jgi:hypothetical protein
LLPTRLLIATLLLANAASPVAAWGPTGHRVVAGIAQNHLTAEAAAVVRELLNPDTLVEASTWADEIKSDDSWGHASVWHYVNLDDGASYVPREITDGEDPRDIHEATLHFVNVLGTSSSSKTERVEAVRWLVHLVGDLHQPLHVGRRGDMGGNRVDAVWHGSPTNMHRVWDSGMIRSTQLSYSELALSIDTASSAEIATWQASSPLDWLSESLALRNRAYQPPDPSRGGSYRYSYEHLDLVRQRLRVAGIRLAGLLNSAL